MLALYKQLTANQYQAALQMLSDGIELCPDKLWLGPVAELKFCQVAFHTLFFTDVYLGTALSELRGQAFHEQHASEFGNYEELEKVRQRQTYEKPFLYRYLRHCRQKADQVVGAETDASLKHTPGFDWLQFSRAEVHLYNIRHIHHHAAQLSLHLRKSTGDGVAWLRLAGILII